MINFKKKQGLYHILWWKTKQNEESKYYFSWNIRRCFPFLFLLGTNKGKKQTNKTMKKINDQKKSQKEKKENGVFSSFLSLSLSLWS